MSTVHEPQPTLSSPEDIATDIAQGWRHVYSIRKGELSQEGTEAAVSFINRLTGIVPKDEGLFNQLVDLAGQIDMTLNPGQLTRKGESGLVEGYDDWISLREQLIADGAPASIARAQRIADELHIVTVDDGK